MPPRGNVKVRSSNRSWSPKAFFRPRASTDIAQPLARRNVDFDLIDLLRRVLRQQLLVGRQAGLALGLARARRHPDPLELTRQCLLPLALGLLFLRQPVLLLLEPRRVVPLPGNALAAVEFQNPLGGVVEEVPVVRHGHDRALVFLEEALQPCHRLGVEVVGRLVQQQQIRRLQQQTAQGHATSFAARQGRDIRVRRRTPQGVHGNLELRVDVPGVDGVDLVLQAPLLVHDLVHLGRWQVFAELHVQLVVAVEQRLDGGHPLLDVALHGLGRIQPRLLLQEPDADAVGRKRLADELGVLTRHDAQQRALARAVQAEHPDLGAWQEREPDVVENAAVGRMHLPEALHGVDVLHGWLGSAM